MPAALYDTCAALFADYPLAVAYPPSVILAVPAEDDCEFFVLGRERGQFRLWGWRDDEDVAVIPEGASPPGRAAEILTEGFPLPAEGSLLGWVQDGAVTAAVTFSVHPDGLYPTFSVMPNMDAAEPWPPFTGELLLGPWLWDYYREGRLADLAGMIARTEKTVFWADTADPLGSNGLAVARDVTGGGITLTAGRYVYWRALQEQIPVPPLNVLLAESSAIDLAPRFQSMAARLTPAGGNR